MAAKQHPEKKAQSEYSSNISVGFLNKFRWEENTLYMNIIFYIQMPAFDKLNTLYQFELLLLMPSSDKIVQNCN